MTELALEWRAMRDEDRNYVLSSWLRSCAEGPEFRSLRRSVYYALYQPVVKAMLARSTVLIASTPDLPDSILGWMAAEGDDVLHYVAVKRRFRRFGVARWMTREMADMTVVYTNQPSVEALPLIGAKWVYEPMRRFERTE